VPFGASFCGRTSPRRVASGFDTNKGFNTKPDKKIEKGSLTAPRKEIEKGACRNKLENA
jgi:hypothetical protein